MKDLRQLPKPGPLTQNFWDEATCERLVRPHCSNCSKSFFPPQMCCPLCLSEDWRWALSRGNGHLYSFTIVNRAPTPGFQTPYVLGVVDLEEGWSMMTNIVGVDPETVRIGMPVQVHWHKEQEMVLPFFKMRAGS